MKKTCLCLLFLFFYFLQSGQTVHQYYMDGRIYLKINVGLLDGTKSQNPRNISPEKISILKPLIAKYGLTKVMKPFSAATEDKDLPHILRIEFSKIEKVNELVAELNGIKGVEYAEKVPLMKTAATPTDPLWATSSGSTHLNQINAQNAWNIFNGNSNITVAIIDNAVMWTHADLVQNTYTNTAEIPSNNIDDDGNGYVDDVNGWDVTDWDNNANPTQTGMDHGTHCAGIAAGSTNNGIGIASIGWNVKMIPVKCQTNNGNPSIVANGFDGIIYAVKAKARIISCSFGNPGSSITEQSVIDYAWNRGCIIMASAGNNGNSSPNYPGAYNNVYCVAAVDVSNIWWSSSSYGTWVDICAPGTNIQSTVPYTSSPAYQTYSGTSMATPLVAGLAALMLSKSPNMTRMNVLNCISSTAANIYTLSGNSTFSTGNLLGAGRIDAYQAMICASTFSAIPPVANFYAFPKNTCPSSPIQFSDSSLYAPTVWSWQFQSGTPATSTATNPVVQWSTPGTYSVMLTVSNGNGTNAITKLSYITISGPLSLPFFEGFEATPFPPPNWTTNNIWNDYIFWVRRANLGAYGTSTACMMFDNYTLNSANERDEMRSPRFDMSNVVTAQLRFDVGYAPYNAFGSDTLEVKISTNCGVTWTPIYLLGGTQLATAPASGPLFIPNASQWRTEVINISTLTAGQGNVMYSFINRGHFGQPIYLDNINLAFPTPTLAIASPPSICIGSPVTFSNTSLSSSSYTWSFPGGSPASSSVLSPTVVYGTPGTYTAVLLGVNGTSTASLTRTVTVYSYPSVSAGFLPTGTLCSGATVTLSASGAMTYSWINTGTGSVVTANPLSSTVYTVIGANGDCTGTQTVLVQTLPAIPMAVTVSTPVVCIGGTITATVSGANSYSWSTGQTSSLVTLSYSTNAPYAVTGFSGSCSITKTVAVTVLPLPISIFILSQPLCAGNCSGGFSVTGTFGSGPFSYSLSSACTQSICTNLCSGNYTVVTTETNGCRGTATFTLTDPPALQSTVVTSDATCPSCNDGLITANITGGVPPYSYNWQPSGGNSSTAGSLVAGCYTLTVTDANGCQIISTTCISAFVGLNENLLKQGLRIFPNPANDKLSIELIGNEFGYTLYNNLGQILATKQKNTDRAELDFSEFAKGVYLVDIESGGFTGHHKVILK